jgi:hypothetical protein
LLLGPLLGLTILIAELSWQSTVLRAQPDTAGLVILSVIGAVLMVIIVMILHFKLLLTRQGVYLTRMTTTFVRWSEVKEIKVG